jgi:hypothetical protein
MRVSYFIKYIVIANTAIVVSMFSTSNVLGAAVLTNGGFETPVIGGPITPFQTFVPGSIAAFNASDVPGWTTTDINNAIEIWKSGTTDPGGSGVTFASFEGNQFAEINAFSDATLSTTVTPSVGSIIGFQFAHRGRASDTIDDVIRVEVFDLGLDGILGGGDDTSLMNQLFSDTNVAWGFYGKDLGISTGNSLLLQFTAVSTASGLLGTGNFLDAVAFGENVVPAPGTALFACIFCAAQACPRRRRATR